MGEMVERVSAAISGAYECRHCGKLTAPINRCQCDKPSWEAASPANQAIAAIEAMREPTEAMLRKSFVAMNETPSGTWKALKAAKETPRRLFDLKMAPRYRAMIDAALAD